MYHKILEALTGNPTTTHARKDDASSRQYQITDIAVFHAALFGAGSTLIAGAPIVLGWGLSDISGNLPYAFHNVEYVKGWLQLSIGSGIASGLWALGYNVTAGIFGGLVINWRDYGE